MSHYTEMRIGKFTLLNYDVLSKLIEFLIGESKAVNDTNLDKKNEFFNQLDVLEKLLAQMKNISLSTDEKELIITGGFVLLSEMNSPVYGDQWQDKLYNTFIDDQSIAVIILRMLKIHEDDGITAKWESILSYKLFIQDSDNYKTYLFRKDEFSKKIKEKYGTDIMAVKWQAKKTKLLVH